MPSSRSPFVWGVVLAAACLWGSPVHSIAGGHGTTAAKFPYVVSIEIANTGGDCVGTIVTEEYVLSSAQCVNQSKYEPTAIRVRSGATQRHMGGVLHAVAAVKKHPSFVENSNDYDVVLLKLKDKIDTSSGVASRAVLAKAAAADPDWSHKLIVTGWGATDAAGNYPEVLLAARLPAVPRRICELVYTAAKLTSRMLCAGAPGKDWCGSDEGAPLVREDSLAVVGIASWHKAADGACDVSGQPGVYTKIGNKEIRDWITKITKA